jgi:hypothetical protein
LLRLPLVVPTRAREVASALRVSPTVECPFGRPKAKQVVGLVGRGRGCFACRLPCRREAARLRARCACPRPSSARLGVRRRSKWWVLSEESVVASPAACRADERPRGCERVARVPDRRVPVWASEGEASGGSCRKSLWLLRLPLVVPTRAREVASALRVSPTVECPFGRPKAKQVVGLVGRVCGCFAWRVSCRREAARLRGWREPITPFSRRLSVRRRSKWWVLSEESVVASPAACRADESPRGCERVARDPDRRVPVWASEGEASGGSCRKSLWLLRLPRVVPTRGREVASALRVSPTVECPFGRPKAKQVVGLVGRGRGCFACRLPCRREPARLRARCACPRPSSARLGVRRRSKWWVLSEESVVASPGACRADERPRGCERVARVPDRRVPVWASEGEASGGSCRKSLWLLRLPRVVSTRA